jgi:hypothetical protein
MRPATTRYLLFVLLPTALAFALAHLVRETKAEARSLESARRLGSLTTVLLREEMADQASQLLARATPRANPDTTSPVVQAALRGDTVAALGTLEGELVLSVALAETEREDSLEPPLLRAEMSAFPASALGSLAGRTGFTSALYLRGDQVKRGGPGDSLQLKVLSEKLTHATRRGPAPAVTEIGKGLVLPLDPQHPTSTPVHLLVVPGRAGVPRALPVLEALILLAGILGGLVLILAGRGTAGGLARSPLTGLLPLYLLPVATLWVSLILSGQQLDRAVFDFDRLEMVRALGLLRDAGRSVELAEITGATGFGATRIRQDGGVGSSLEDEPLIRRLAGLPPPQPSGPSTGSIGREFSEVRYASMAESDDVVLILSAQTTEGSLRTGRLFQAVLGGVASLLGLLWVFSASRSRRGREERPPMRNEERGP